MHSSGSDTPREKEYEREDISNLTKAKSKGGGGVSASWRSQNGVSRPSWTDSGGQDGVFGGANTGQEGPEGGSNLLLPGAKTEGKQNQRSKAPKQRVQINRKSSSSR